MKLVDPHKAGSQTFIMKIILWYINTCEAYVEKLSCRLLLKLKIWKEYINISESLFIYFYINGTWEWGNVIVVTNVFLVSINGTYLYDLEDLMSGCTILFTSSTMNLTRFYSLFLKNYAFLWFLDNLYIGVIYLNRITAFVVLCV